MKRSRGTPVNLSDSVHRQLSMYALAASAAGVGMLALPPPADAKVVYTKAHVVIKNQNQTYPLDLNHDGINDFQFLFVSCSGAPSGPNGCRDSLYVAPYNGGNAVWKVPCFFGSCAAALTNGLPVHVGLRRPFSKKQLVMVGFVQSGSGTGALVGPWVDVTRRYLGLKFYVKGKVHYGWARLNTNSLTAVLTGYAYETIPGKAIITGKTKGPDVITLEPGSLGALAAGSAGRSGK